MNKTVALVLLICFQVSLLTCSLEVFALDAEHGLYHSELSIDMAAHDNDDLHDEEGHCSHVHSHHLFIGVDCDMALAVSLLAKVSPNQDSLSSMTQPPYLRPPRI